MYKKLIVCEDDNFNIVGMKEDIKEYQRRFHWSDKETQNYKQLLEKEGCVYVGKLFFSPRYYDIYGN